MLSFFLHILQFSMVRLHQFSFIYFFFLIGKDNSLKRGARKATQGKQNYARYTNLNTHHQKAKKNKEAQKVT